MTAQFLGSTVKTDVVKVRKWATENVADLVTTEEPLEIRILYSDEGRATSLSISVTMRTPRHDFELAAGFLFTEGILNDRDDIDRMSYCMDEGVEQHYNIVNVHLKPGVAIEPDQVVRNFFTTSSCGICGKASLEALELKDYPIISTEGPYVSKDIVYGLPTSLRAAQRVFDRTGGLHAAGLFSVEGSLSALREDIGRHNAVDKLVGYSLLSGNIPLGNSLLVVSGRSSFEIMQKALSARLPIVIAVGAPSSLAVDLARRFGMTLVGFARDDVFNIYSRPERIV